MEGEYVAVACGLCKQVSAYSGTEFRDAGMTDMPDPFDSGQLRVWHGWLGCDTKGCEALVGTFASRPFHVAIEQMLDEVEDWKADGTVKCRCGSNAVSPRATSLRQHDAENDPQPPIQPK
jgi:hypothetical protein